MAPSLARTMPRADSGKAVQRVGGYRTSPLGAQVSRVGPRVWPRPWRDAPGRCEKCSDRRRWDAAPQHVFDHIFLDRGHVQSWQRTRPAEISRSLAMVATYEYAPKYEDAE